MELHVTSYLTRVILSYADIRAVEGKKKKGKKISEFDPFI